MGELKSEQAPVERNPPTGPTIPPTAFARVGLRYLLLRRLRVLSIPASFTSPFFALMRFSILHLLLAAVIGTGAGACKRKDVTVYVAPKDGSGAPATPRMPSPPDTAGGSLDENVPKPAPRAALPRLAWTLPPGWTEATPGQMSVASFKLPSDAGQAGVSITPLPDLSGREADVVSLWRQQAGAPELPADQVESTLKPVEVAGGSGKLVEIDGTRDGKATRIVSAMFNRPDGTWFFKLAGDDAAVAAQKPAFLDFLKSVRFEDALSAGKVVAGAPANSTDPSKPPEVAKAATNEPPTVPALEAPEGWRPLTAGQMQVAKYSVPEQGDAKAEVAVSMFSSDTGGPVANIARWRRQLGLPEATESEIAPMAKPLDPSLPGALLAELQNEKRWMIGAIVPRASGWWFYKLTGDEAAVAAAPDSFLSFVKSQPKS